MISSLGRNMSLKELYDLHSQSTAIGSEMQKIQIEIGDLSGTFGNYYNKVSKINEDSFNKIVGEDSATKSMYKNEFRMVSNFAETLKVGFTKYLNILGTKQLENRALIYKNSLMTLLIWEELKEQQKRIVIQDEPYLWNIFSRQYPNFGTVLRNSFDMVYTSLSTYFDYYLAKGIIFKLILIAIAFFPYFYLKHLRKKHGSQYVIDLPLDYLNKLPLLICLIFALVLLSFAIEYPPYALNQIMLLAVMTLTSVIVLKEFISREYRILFILIFLYYIIMRINDLITEPTIVERILYFLSIVPAFLVIRFFSAFLQNVVRNKEAVRILMFFLLAHLLAGFFLNLFGRVALCRVIISSGLNAFFMGIFLMLLIYSLMDYIYLLADLYNSLSKNIQIDIENVRAKIIRLLWFFAVIYWVTNYLVDFNSLAFISDKLSAFLSEPRAFGMIDFTIGTVLVFVLVLYLSYYISSLIKDLLETKDTVFGKAKKNNSGGILLIARLFIVGFGFIFALAASGIAIDRLTIVLGALSVGIGFGLQNIINNLVSGVIIAFEKPFKIGDLVEIENVQGRVNELGIRSSTISTAQGAELIVPNGELISKKLVNWTRSDNSKVETIHLKVEANVSEESIQKIINDSVTTPAIGTLITSTKTFLISLVSGESQTWLIQYRVSDLTKCYEIKSSLILSIKANLERENVKIVKCQ
jgi:small-conductance mechanosensitive channel